MLAKQKENMMRTMYENMNIAKRRHDEVCVLFFHTPKILFVVVSGQASQQEEDR